jgi:hypothetical protein
VDIYTIAEIDRLQLFDLATDTAAQAAAKLAQRNTLRANHVMKHISDEDSLARELVSTLDHKIRGAFREACKRKTT